MPGPRWLHRDGLHSRAVMGSSRPQADIRAFEFVTLKPPVEPERRSRSWSFSGWHTPAAALRAIDAFMEGDILAHGSLRLRCGESRAASQKIMPRNT